MFLLSTASIHKVTKTMRVIRREIKFFNISAAYHHSNIAWATLALTPQDRISVEDPGMSAMNPTY